MGQEPTTALATQTNSRTLTFDPPLPDKLNALLLSRESPVVGPDTAATLRAFAETPEPPLPTEGHVETMIGKLAIATAQAKVSQAEANARHELYWLALRDIPLDDLRTAFLTLIRTSKFLPTPAEVRTAAWGPGALRRYRKSRARHLAWRHDTMWEPPKELLPPDEAKALIASLAPAATDMEEARNA